ncbi:unnamed protein product [Linum trigynum]|uniref:Uncharacterized protein n=1 Tax=Linum trigynum TaxID=586398 RepID=A0AAV2EY95_9ROSI
MELGQLLELKEMVHLQIKAEKQQKLMSGRRYLPSIKTVTGHTYEAKSHQFSSEGAKPAPRNTAHIFQKVQEDHRTSFDV